MATAEKTPLLEVKSVSKAFPGVQALKDVDFSIYPGEVVALVGENGAGKSTLMKILSGAYRMDSGTIHINGDTVTPENPRHAQGLGISIIYQEFNLTPQQSVATNIFLGREPTPSGLLGMLSIVDRRRMRREAARLLERVGAGFSPNTPIRRLSVAEQQMVEIAKALSAEARIIIMDEPTSALGEDEVKVLFQIIRNLKEQDIGVVFITHRLEEVFEIADRIVVLRDGEQVGGMPVKEATTDDVIALMVGRAIDKTSQHAGTDIGDTVLEVKGLSRKGVLHDISFSLRRGEILGIAGLVGSGRTESARAIFGADPIDAGELFIDGQRVNIKSPAVAVNAGIALVPEDRKKHGLVLMHSLQHNIMLPNLNALTVLSEFVSKRRARSLAGEYVERLNIRTPGLGQQVKYLSGGNQQKTVLAKWLAGSPKVLIMDEPTRGIDVGAKAEVHNLMSQLARLGIAIIMISSELPEVLLMSDRILVMHEGRVAAILDREEATQEIIMSYASGSTETATA
ncbi:MAG: sugar ABC transporter ATP-binding protein [Anaerolineae bacterium]|nr:sugar ABC transporter ATP-binding protein [Anaerolineae bacterium]